MGSFSIWHWLVVLLVVLLLFGSGKVSNLMGDFAKGIKSFKKNMADEGDESMEASAQKPAGTISGPNATTGATTGTTTGANTTQGSTTQHS
jgi:sec-independent protein translocase protein TatA